MPDKDPKQHGDSEAHGAAHGAGMPGGPGGHGGGGSHEEAHEGAPEWIISFADNTALMMGFFVILLALNMGPKAAPGGSSGDTTSEASRLSGQSMNQLDWAIAVRKAFNNPVTPDSTNPRDRFLVMRVRELMQAESEDPGQRGHNTKVESPRDTDYRNLYGNVPFDTGSAAVGDAGRKAIAENAQHVRGLKLVIELRGHASAAEAFDQADHGMKLSFDRALAVGQLLAQEGLDWKQLRLVPCGDNDRIRPLAYDPQAHAQNQSVEIVVTGELLK